MNRRQGILLLALGFVLKIGFYASVALIFRRAEFFRVTQIEVVGLRYLQEGDVVRHLDLPTDASTIDLLDDVRASAATIPGIVASRVERRLPGTLVITVQEAAPVALTAVDDRLMLIDVHGKVLPFDPTNAPASLPIVERDSVLTALIGRVMSADPTWYATMETARGEGGHFVLEGADQRIRLQPDAGLDVLRGVIVVRDYLESRGVAWREIDARYRNRVFVQKAKGAA